MTNAKRLRFSAMQPLPERPRFPVFGLAESFVGFRWLLMWQRRVDAWTGDVTEVDLAHGHPDDGPFVIVRTVLKQPVRDRDNGGVSGPLGLEYLASGLVLNAVDSPSPDVNHQRALLLAEQQLIEETVDGGAVLQDWSAGAVSIDGAEVQAQVRDIGEARAVVVDFPGHAVGVVGPARSLSAPALADVSAGLSAYRAGTDDRADSLLM